MLEEFYDYNSMAEEIGVKMMVVHRVKEPTLNQLLKSSARPSEVRKPAWRSAAEAHPGLPDHYFAANELESDSMEPLDENYVHQLPFDINREIHMKLLIASSKPRRNKKKLPSLEDLMNGTIVIAGDDLPVGSENNIEIFLSLHEKLLPCCLIQRSDIIFESPSTKLGRVRCYFVSEASAPNEITFFSSQRQVLHQTQNFQVKWFHGSTPYKFLHL